jgi:hypothetical protein
MDSLPHHLPYNGWTDGEIPANPPSLFGAFGIFHLQISWTTQGMKELEDTFEDKQDKNPKFAQVTCLMCGAMNSRKAI